MIGSAWLTVPSAEVARYEKVVWNGQQERAKCWRIAICFGNRNMEFSKVSRGTAGKGDRCPGCTRACSYVWRFCEESQWWLSTYCDLLKEVVWKKQFIGGNRLLKSINKSSDWDKYDVRVEVCDSIRRRKQNWRNVEHTVLCFWEKEPKQVFDKIENMRESQKSLYIQKEKGVIGCTMFVLWRFLCDHRIVVKIKNIRFSHV